eukprot:SAG22_NODE_17893_length_297_cov_0.500000_1_plen_27_part_10
MLQRLALILARQRIGRLRGRLPLLLLF